MNEIVRHAGMTGILPEQLVQQGDRFFAIGESRVVRWLGSQQRQRKKGTGFVIAGMIPIELAHGGGVSRRAGQVILLAVPVKFGESSNVSALARRGLGR